VHLPVSLLWRIAAGLAREGHRDDLGTMMLLISLGIVRDITARQRWRPWCV
jgi:hypothetical protein